MATQIVAPVRCPDISDILMSDSDCDTVTDLDELSRIKDASENTFMPIIEGMESIGYLLWHASTYTNEPVDQRHLGNLGWLMQELARTASLLHDLRSTAVYQHNKLSAKAKGARS